MGTACNFCGKESHLKPETISDLRKMIENILAQHKVGIKDVAGGMRISLACSHCKRIYSAAIAPASLDDTDNF